MNINEIVNYQEKNKSLHTENKNAAGKNKTFF